MRIRTPCIGICSTTYGGDVCRGCKRFAHEVIDWNAYSEAQKQLVWDRLARLAREVVLPSISIQNEVLLAGTLRSLGLRVHDDQDAVFGVLELLRALGGQRVDTSRFGIAPLPPWDELSPGEMYRRMNAELYLRAEAWFDLHHGRTRQRLDGERG